MNNKILIDRELLGSRISEKYSMFLIFKRL